MTYRIAAIGGDGIGPEVLAEGVKVLQAGQATTAQVGDAIAHAL
jgi:isocitrate/isopropylmalate dehydrogenase